MEVRIYVNEYLEKPGYRGAIIELPATKAAITDAMDMARVQENKKYSLDNFEGWPECVEFEDIRHDISIEEVNFLAKRIQKMSGFDYRDYEGAVAVLKQKEKSGVLGIKDLINATYNLHCFDFVPGFVNDKELGTAAIEMEFWGEIKEIPEGFYDLIDEEKAGRYMRLKEEGAYTTVGYCHRCGGEWQEVYDGKTLPKEEQEEEGVLSLCLVERKQSMREAEVWLELPFSKSRIKEVLAALQVQYLKDCRVSDVQSVIPAFRYLIDYDVDIDGLNNSLAKRLTQMDDQQRLKYKAVLEYEDCERLDKAEELLERLDEYTFEPAMVTYADYGKACLEMQGVDWHDPAFRYFDFDEFGKNQCELSGFTMTSYGMVVRKEAISEEQNVEEGMQMGGL